MSEPKTARARSLGSRMWSWNKDTPYDEISTVVANIWRDLTAIEAEACAEAEVTWKVHEIGAAFEHGRELGRADALREAAERVRALGDANKFFMHQVRPNVFMALVETDEVLAILDPALRSPDETAGDGL